MVTTRVSRRTERPPSRRERPLQVLARSEAASVVGYLDVDVTVLSPPAHPESTRMRLLQAMANRILDERLKQHGGDAGVERVRLDLIVHLQPVSETRPFDREVGVDELQLLAKRDLILVAPGERPAEQATESGYELRRLAVAALSHEPGDRVERIEEEVWLELRTEGVELRP